MFQHSHQWDGCVCRECNEIKDEENEHQWDECQCIKCGVFRHIFNSNCVCVRCGEIIHTAQWQHRARYGYSNLTRYCLVCGRLLSDSTIELESGQWVMTGGSKIREGSYFDLGKFDEESKEIWNCIGEKQQQQLLKKNFYCPKCESKKEVRNIGGMVEDEDLVLHGACFHCESKLFRIIMKY